jgi:hypothetical protein
MIFDLHPYTLKRYKRVQNIFEPFSRLSFQPKTATSEMRDFVHPQSKKPAQGCRISLSRKAKSPYLQG